MIKNKSFITLSAALILCGSLSSIQAFDIVTNSGKASVDVNNDSSSGGSVEVHHDSNFDWLDVEHNHYFGSDFRYEQGARVARWPYEHSTEVSPAYIDEDYQQWRDVHKIHGHAVAVQFNPDQSGDIRTDQFVLRDSKGAVVETEWANGNLNDREYAIVPKHRLDWDSEYHVDFTYHEDGTPKEQHWTFRTQKLDHPIYDIADHKNRHDVAKGSTYAFYVGESDADVEASFQHNGAFKVDKTVDHDTFYVGVNANVGSNVTATVNGEEQQFHVFTNEIKDVEFTHVDDRSVALRWHHERSGEERGYKIYRDGKFIARVSADTTIYTDTSVKPGVRYTYTVKVTNDS